MTERVGDLEIPQNLDIERREWQVERLARVALFGLILAALLGLTGPGPLSWTDEHDGALSISYDRFVRRGGSTELDVRIAPSGGPREVDVRIDRGYLGDFTVDSISPEPASTRSEGQWVVYTFERGGGAGEVEVSFALTPTGLWAVSGRIALGDGSVVTPAHFVYP